MYLKFSAIFFVLFLVGCQTTAVRNAQIASKNYCKNLDNGSLDPIRNKIALFEFGKQSTWPMVDHVSGIPTSSETDAIRKFVKISQLCGEYRRSQATGSGAVFMKDEMAVRQITQEWLRKLAQKEITYPIYNRSFRRLIDRDRLLSNDLTSNNYQYKIDIIVSQLLEFSRLEEMNWRQLARKKGRQIVRDPDKAKRPGQYFGSGFFVSRTGNIVTNAHVVKSCNQIQIGSQSKNNIRAKLVSIDHRNDLALLKISASEMLSHLKKLGVSVSFNSATGLFSSRDVKLGERIIAAGYPYGTYISTSIKITSGVVSATRGFGDNTGQFQLDAAVQPGNSGGPIYDSRGNIVGVIVSGINKLKVAKASGSVPENINFGIKVSTVRTFLESGGVSVNSSSRIRDISSRQIAAIAEKQTLMIRCFR